MKAPSEHHISTVIFDFDGTLADSLMAFIRTGEEILGISPPTPKAEVYRMRSLKPQQIMKQYGIKAWQIPGLLIEGRKRFMGKIGTIELFPGVSELLNNLHEAGYRLCIVSTNSEQTIRKILRRHGLQTLIDAIYAGGTVTGKALLIRRLLKCEGLTAGECVYVGDEVRDIEAVRKSKVHGVSVSWGYQSKEVLRKKNPEALIDKPGALLKTLERL